MVLTPPMGAMLGGRVGVGVACGSPSVAFKEVRRGLGYEEAQGDLWMPPGTYRWFLPHLSWELGISVHAKMTMMLPCPRGPRLVSPTVLGGSHKNSPVPE